MTIFHYLIESGATLDESAKIYRVAIHQSAQGDRDYLFLIAYAADHGFFFERDSIEVSEFVMRVRSAHNIPDSNFCLADARSLVRAIKADIKQPLTAESLSQSHRQKLFLSLDYRASSRLSALSNSLPTSRT